MPDNEQTSVQINLRADLARSDLKKGHIWFVNYAAIDPTAVTASQLDSHGTGMLPDDVELLAHRWLKHSRSVDINHDGKGRPVWVLESFFNSDQVQAAAWPRNAHCLRLDVSQSKEAMGGLRNGTLNSLSLDAYTINRRAKVPTYGAAGTRPSTSFRSDGLTVEECKYLIRASGHDDSSVTSVRRLDNMYIVMRAGKLPPVAIAAAADGFDVDLATGAAAAVVMRAATLTFTADLLQKVLSEMGVDSTTTDLNKYAIPMTQPVE